MRPMFNLEILLAGKSTLQVIIAREQFALKKLDIHNTLLREFPIG